MILIINTTTAHKGGSVQVALSFLKEFKEFKVHHFHVFIGPALKDIINISEFPKNFNFYFFKHRPSQKLLTLNPLSIKFKKIEEKIKADFVITTSGPSYWRPSSPHIIGYNLPHYIYEDSPFWKIATISTKLRFFLLKFIIRYFYKKDADYYFVQTDDVRKRLIKFIDNPKVFTVPNTCGFTKKSVPNNYKVLPPKEGKTFRFLTLSAYYEHKNLEIIGLISKKLESLGYSNVEFIVTLSEDAFLKCFKSIGASKIINVGTVKPEDCALLYEECDALILPTLLECFSANYVEAMFMQKPIVTTDLSFAKTVCKEAALYFEPLNENDAVNKIISLIDNPNAELQLIKKGNLRLKNFPSAKQRANLIINIVNKLLANNE